MIASYEPDSYAGSRGRINENVPVPFTVAEITFRSVETAFGLVQLAPETGDEMRAGFLAVALTMSATSVVAAPFDVVVASKDTMQVLDKGSRYEADGNVRIWGYTFLAATKPLEGASVDYISTLHEFDCKARRHRSVSMIAYEVEKGPVWRSDETQGWEFPDPSTYMFGAMTGVCDPKFDATDGVNMPTPSAMLTSFRNAVAKGRIP